MEQVFGFDKPIKAVVIGASGGIGGAFVSALLERSEVEQVMATSRSIDSVSREPDQRISWFKLDITDEQSVEAFANSIQPEEGPTLIVNCSGVLHTTSFGPERSWRHLDMDAMRSVFEVNTFGPALLMKHLIPTVPIRQRSVFASLSARVSSLSDNRLGGWYSYRASKTAQNMMLKTAALEAKRRFPELVIAGLHPGTVSTALSAPFTKRLPQTHSVFTPEESAEYLLNVISTLEPTDSGGLFAWDGQLIPW